jgi:hypothetical protein
MKMKSVEICMLIEIQKWNQAMTIVHLIDLFVHKGQMWC